MSGLSHFPITRRWPAEHPDRLQLYSLDTPNGVKVSIMLEEIGLPYEPHLVDILKDESKTSEFLSLNPNGKIPAIIDPDGPDGRPIGLFESGAILLYLADKTGQLMPADPARPLGGDPVGVLPDGRRRADVRPGRLLPQVRRRRDRRQAAARTLCRRRRSGCSACSRRGSAAGPGSMGDEYTIADISLLGWVRNLIGFYEARELVDFDALKHVPPGSSVAWRGRRCNAVSNSAAVIRHSRTAATCTPFEA